KADRAEKDRIVRADLREPVVRHHRAGLEISLAAPVEMIPGEAQPVLRSGRFEHADPLRDDFLADAVAGDDGYPMLHRGGCAAIARTPRRLGTARSLRISAGSRAGSPARSTARTRRSGGRSAARSCTGSAA